MAMKYISPKGQSTKGPNVENYLIEGVTIKSFREDPKTKGVILYTIEVKNGDNQSYVVEKRFKDFDVHT